MKTIRAFLAATAIAATGMSAAAEEVTLTIHHFQPATGATQTQMIEPWANAVTEQSGGRIRFEIYPSMSMGGRANELYGQARDGFADIVWVPLGYTPGVFRHAEVFELPLVHAGSASHTTTALNQSLDILAEDFRSVQLLFLHSHGGNVIHSATRPARTFDDVNGMKLRTPSRTGTWLLEEWRAEPVGMPVPDLPQAMSRGVVDGALTSYEVVPEINLQQLDRYVTEPADGDSFGTLVFMMAMNKERYESLPEDLRAVIDANSGAAVAGWVGRMWEDKDQIGIDALDSANVEKIVLSADETARFAEASQRVIDRWIEEMDASGLDGAELVEKARSAIAAAAE